MSNQLYEFTLKVVRGPGCDMPGHLAGAYVPCYAAAEDYQAAIKKGIAALASMNFIFEDIQGDVREVPLVAWPAYVFKTWPEFASHFPAEGELPGLIEKGGVFLGPFVSFEA